MRQHIGKALQARSQAIRTALDHYNEATALLYPDRDPLKWDEVVQYASLADFDILRDARQDISERPWASSAGRIVMDQYFKLKRAEEEIQRLNVEIPRLVTYMIDEDEFLREREEATALVDSGLAYQIRLYRLERSRYTTLHMQRLRSLARLPGFTGNLRPGQSLKPLGGVRRGVDRMEAEGDGWDDEHEDEVDEVEEDEARSNALVALVQMTSDQGRAAEDL